jgi:putative FmdB family regulatory protein
MPHYDYQCEKCGHRYEKFQQMTDAPDTVCPECGAPVRRLIGTGAGLVFKGSGFYETDYKRKSSACSTQGGKTPSCCDGCCKKDD